jgi:putative transposase
MRKLMKKQGVTPATIVTDKLGSYSSALRELGVARRHDTRRWKNNRAKKFPSAIATTGTTNERQR